MFIFNIRVYGLVINDREELLVTDEFRAGMKMTKLPGGGLNWGEGIHDCLKREFKEELNCSIDILEHFYTTDFFQISAFNNEHQLISIYYKVKITTPLLIPISNKIADLKEIEGAQTFRWMPLKELDENKFTFPIDKKIAQMLYKQ